MVSVVKAFRKKKLPSVGGGGSTSESTTTSDLDAISRGCFRATGRKQGSLNGLNVDGTSETGSNAGDHALDAQPNNPKPTKAQIAGSKAAAGKVRLNNAGQAGGSASGSSHTSDEEHHTRELEMARCASPGCMAAPVRKLPMPGVVRRRLTSFTSAKPSRRAAAAAAYAAGVVPGANGSAAPSPRGPAEPVTMEDIALGAAITPVSPRPVVSAFHAPGFTPEPTPRNSFEIQDKQKRLGQLSPDERATYLDFLHRELANGEAKELGLSDSVLSFIYRCHKEDLERSRAATAQFLKFKNFHANNVRKGAVAVTEDMIANENQRRKNVISISPGTNGNPVVISFLSGRRHLRNGKVSLSEKVCQLLYGLEIIVDAVEARDAEFHFVFDIRGLGVKNADVPFMQQIACLQKVFRDLMKKIYIVNAGPVAMSFWKIIKPLFSPRILEKIQVMKGGEFKSALPVAAPDELHPLIRASWDKSCLAVDAAGADAAEDDDDALCEAAPQPASGPAQAKKSVHTKFMFEDLTVRLSPRTAVLSPAQRARAATAASIPAIPNGLP